MIKRISAMIITLFLITTLTACGKNVKDAAAKNDDAFEGKDGKIKIMTSFNAMGQFAKAVGKDKVDVQVIVPNGTEPHDFEPKPKDLANLSKAQIFIYNGFGMENWVGKTLDSVNNKNMVVVEAAKGCNPIKNSDEASIKEHGQYDPHTWISLSMAKIECNNIKEALIQVDPKNKTYYEKNYNDFAARLDGLLKEYGEKFSLVKNKDFVTGHAAFAYFCRDFNLNQNSVEDVFAEGEPTPKRMEELINYCKKNNVKTIFVESMASPKVSETLAKEVNAKVEKIYTTESQEDGKDYLQSMEENLNKVHESLK